MMLRGPPGCRSRWWPQRGYCCRRQGQTGSCIAKPSPASECGRQTTENWSEPRWRCLRIRPMGRSLGSRVMSKLGWIRKVLRETADSCPARSRVPREIRGIEHVCRRYGAPWLRVAKAHRCTGSGRSYIENMVSGRRTSDVYRAGRAPSARTRCDSVKPIMETPTYTGETRRRHRGRSTAFHGP